MKCSSTGNSVMRCSPTLRFSLLMQLLILAFCLGHERDAIAAPLQHAPAFSSGINTRFAFADFDGDRQPDLAFLQVEQFSSLKMHYSITFAFGNGNRQSIMLIGPSGGLQILPRDVNGDHSLDLVVAAERTHRAVAILLNDGFGGFTSADPGKYPIDIQQFDTALRPAPLPWERYAVLLGRRSLSGECAETSSLSLPRRLPGPLFSMTPYVPSHLPGSFSGRAPPNFSNVS